MARQRFAPVRRKDKIWSGIGSGANSFATNATSLLVAVSFGTDHSTTIMRILGNWFVQPTPGGTIAALDNAEIALAIGVVSSDAAALGLTAMPDPITDEGYPWLYWKSFFCELDSADTTSPGNNPGHSHYFDIDVKSMRKIKPNESLVVVAQYLDNVGTPFMTVHFSGARILRTVT